MIEIKFTGDTVEDVMSQIVEMAQSLSGGSDDSDSSDGGEQTTAKPKRKRRTKAEMEADRAAEAASKAAEAGADDKTDSVADDTPAEPEKPAAPSVDDLKAAGAKVVNAGNPAAVKAALAEAGVAKISDVPEDKRAAVLAAFEKAIEDAAALA